MYFKYFNVYLTRSQEHWSMHANVDQVIPARLFVDLSKNLVANTKENGLPIGGYSGFRTFSQTVSFLYKIYFYYAPHATRLGGALIRPVV